MRSLFKFKELSNIKMTQRNCQPTKWLGKFPTPCFFFFPPILSIYCILSISDAVLLTIIIQEKINFIFLEQDHHNF